MCKVEGELPTPPEIIKTVTTLAPKGSPVEQTVAAMQLAADLYQAKHERSAGQQKDTEADKI